MMRMAISLRFRASNFFIRGSRGPASILQCLPDALGQQIHKPFRIEAVHPAGDLAVPVYDDRGGNGGDLEHAREAVFEIDGVGPVTLIQEQRHQDRKSTRLNSSHPSISYAVF